MSKTELMKNIDDFIDFIEITKQENGEFGLNPMMGYILTEDNKNEILALIGIDSVQKCYKLFLHYIKKKAKKIYLAVDFPPVLNSGKDFVLFHIFECNKKPGDKITDIETFKRFFTFDMLALPYDKITGKRFEIEKKKQYIDFLEIQFQNIMTSEIRKTIRDYANLN